MSNLNKSVMLLDMSLVAAKAVLAESKEPLQRRLAWLGAELERLATEAFRLADEAGDDEGASPAHTGWEPPLPGFDT
jgi:hypothetical protein